MSENICPYSATLTKDDFACEHAQKVIRRGGEEFACQNPEMHSLCSDAHATVRKNALDQMGLEDDLTSLPHSVLVKIQFGCLLGLLRNKEETAVKIANIAALISSYVTTTDDMSELPFEKINQEITHYKSPKRRRKK